MKEALFYTRKENLKVECNLCPHNCLIKTDKRGICGVRKNEQGELIAETYERATALGFDPIEKKPLYHFCSGDIILSLGSLGCNLSCLFCQNCDISQSNFDNFPYLQHYTANQVVEMAVNRPNNTGIAFTYNEPTVFYEYMYDTAKLAKSKNLQTVMVTNGYINPKPLQELLPLMDAFSVDLKGFDEKFYKEATGAELEPVKETLTQIKNANKHLEIINLVIPQLNDEKNTFKLMVDWIASELGKDTVLHLSRYFPNYKLTNPPTPIHTLTGFYHAAKEKLHYVYLGNTPGTGGENDTFCAKCNTRVIKRLGYTIKTIGIDKTGYCKNCGNKVITTACNKNK